MAKGVQVVEIPVGAIEVSEFNANTEDTATFQRLVREIEEHGLLELPLVAPNSQAEDDTPSYRILAGEHRIAACRHLKWPTVTCRVYSGPALTPEDEFNLVNNLNMVRGQVTRAQAVKVIRAKELDPSKLDLFKMPVGRLLAELSPEDRKKLDDDAQRKARIRNLTLQVAGQIAETMVDEKDELVSVLVVNDKMAAVIRLPLKNGARARQAADQIKEIVAEAVGKAAGEAPTVVEAEAPTGDGEKDG